MHRIDGPGATVDNRFTDGDPVGGTQATMVTDDWANDVQEELMSVLAAGGIAPVKGVQDQVLKAIRAISGGVVGASRNVRMSVPTASASATVTADQIYVSSALSGQSYRLSSFNKTINLSTTGAGGMDTGTAPVNGFVGIYAIYNPTSGASALLAVNATAAAVPEIYGGANMPAGYTASALLTVVPTNGSSQFVPLYVVDRQVFIATVSIIATTTQSASPVSFSAAGAVPKNARLCRGNIQVVSTVSGATISGALSGSSAGLGTSGFNTNNNAVNGGLNSPYTDVPLITVQTLFYTGTVTSGAITLSATVTSYTI